MEESTKVKINILTGFLGSGKTTLVSKILNTPQLKSKVLFIQNELSEDMGIEKETLLDSDGNNLGNIIEMPNGCLCCAVKDNLVVFLERALEKFKEIKCVVIEAHGLTDVSQLILKMWLDNELESPLKLNSIICIVDVINFFNNFDENEEILKKQLICSDKVILNKMDLNKDPQNISNIKQFIIDVNPVANFKETSYSEIDVDFFLESNSKNDTFNLNEKEHHHDGNCHHMNFHEKYLIENIMIKFNSTGIKNKEQIDKIVGNLLWNDSEEFNFSIIRIKGIIFTENEVFSIQGIYDVYEVLKIKEMDGRDKLSKILVIGKNIQKNYKLIESKFI